MAENPPTTNPSAPLRGLSVDEIEANIKKHWVYAEYYFAEILAGTRTVEESREDLQSLITAYGAAKSEGPLNG